MPDKYLLLFLLVGSGSVAFAQDQNAPSGKPIQIQTDSIVINRIDSISNKVNQPIGYADGLAEEINARQDTIFNYVANRRYVMDSIRNKLNVKIDSLTKLQLPTQHYVQLLDSLETLTPDAELQEIRASASAWQSKLESAYSKANQPLDEVENNINAKLTLIQQQGGDTHLPSNIEILERKGPDLNVDPQFGISGKGVDNSLPEVTTPTLEIGKLSDVSPNVPQTDLQNLQNALEKTGEVTDQVSDYSDDLNQLAEGNLANIQASPELLENEAINKMNADELVTKSQVIDEHKALITSAGDQQAIKEKLKQQIPTLAKNHFEGQEIALKDAIDKVTNLKKKFVELDNLEDLPKHPPNPMKKKTFIERIIPGITFQIQKSDNIWVDYNPYIGYRLSGKLTAGMGWNERIGITSGGFTTSDRVYGPRSFINYNFRKGFSFHADVEKMFATVPPELNNSSSIVDGNNQQWVWGFFAGIKKEYDFVKTVKGNLQLLYNIYTDHGRSPYTSRFSIRFGFEFPLKKNR